jgi:GR25 family glycosyltransferase involved in LPS biosynthesis
MWIIFILLVVVLFLLLSNRSYFTEEQPPCFVISLPGSKRREFINNEFKKIPELKYEFFDGIKITNKEELINELAKYDYTLDPSIVFDENTKWGNFGLNMAHLRLLKYIVDNNIQMCIYFEDDIELNPEGIRKFLNNPKEFIKPYENFDWIFTHSYKEKSFGCQCQIITLKCAQNFLKEKDKYLDRTFSMTNVYNMIDMYIKDSNLTYTQTKTPLCYWRAESGNENSERILFQKSL